MIKLSLGKLDLNEIPESNRVFALQQQVKSLASQLELVLSSIDASDVTVSEDKTLADILNELSE